MIIIGLGNPGKKYEKTRHNVGHMATDQLKKEELGNFILAKTGIFMNESGKSAKKLIADYKLPIADLVIIHDDIDIPLGEFKIQKGRSSAGHKGAQSVIDELRTKDFWRVRIGIRPERGKPANVEKFVLQNFTKSEQKMIKEVIKKIPKALETIIKKS